MKRAKLKYELKEPMDVEDWMTCVWTLFKGGWEGMCYQWTDKGELEYKCWWNQRFLATSHHYILGNSAISMHKCVGQIRKPDKKITIDVVHTVNRVLETKWQNAKQPDEKKRIAKMGTWFMGGFCMGLCGEEMLLTEVAWTANSLIHMDDAKNDFVFVVTGRTKCNQKSYAKFGVPCAPVTEGTYLRPGHWVKWLVDIIHGPGIREACFSLANLPRQNSWNLRVISLWY
jgi:hypothetical protein